MAQKHNQVADNITSQQKTLSANIQNLTTVNQGAMMTKLVSVHDAWDGDTTQIVTSLHDMANTLESVAQQLEAQDQENDVTV
jgi:hypothetical protein